MSDNVVKDKIIYQIYHNNVEYYTFTLPRIDESFIWCKSMFQKKSVNEYILEEKIEEFYREDTLMKDKKDGDLSEINLTLKDGVGIRLMEIDNKELSWLDITLDIASSKLKDRILAYYQKAVPNLLQTVSQLQKKIEMMNAEDEGDNIGNISRSSKGNKFLLP